MSLALIGYGGFDFNRFNINSQRDRSLPFLLRGVFDRSTLMTNSGPASERERERSLAFPFHTFSHSLGITHKYRVGPPALLPSLLRFPAAY